MSERLRPRDLAFLAAESPTTPMHNATVEIFDPGDSGFDHDRLVELIADRIAFVPRYRQRLQVVPGRLANPVWVDDEDFDLGYHVRRSALPRPGTMDQLRELVARIVSRPLDRSRPLWECYFVEGLEDGRVALLSKSHQILVDGRETVDLGQVLLDTSPDRRPSATTTTGAPGVRPVPWRLRSTRSPTASRARARCGRRPGPTPRRSAGRPRPRVPASRRSRARWPGAARCTPRRCTASSPSSAASSPYAPSWPTTARSARSTAAPSTTSSWPRSPAACAAG